MTKTRESSELYFQGPENWAYLQLGQRFVEVR